MAKGPIDFEALADMYGDKAPTFRDAPTTKKGKIDFEALADQMGGSVNETGTFVPTRDTAKERLGRLNRATQAEAVPTAEGTVGLDALASSWKPKRGNESFASYAAPEIGQPVPVTGLGSLAHNAGVDAKSIVAGTADMAQFGIRGLGNVLTPETFGGNSPKGFEQLGEAAATFGGGLKFGAEAPGALVGTILQDIGMDKAIPLIGEWLHETGTTREDFERMLQQNPVGTLLSIFGPVAGRVQGANEAGAKRSATLQQGFEEVGQRQGLEELAQLQKDQHLANEGDVVTPDQSRMGVEQAWRDRVEQQTAEQRSAREIENTRPWSMEQGFQRIENADQPGMPVIGDPALIEQARQNKLIEESGGRIVDENGQPRYVGGDQPPESAVAAGNQAGFNKAEFEGALNQGLAEQSPRNLPSEGFKGWSMEEGFNAAPETLEWIDNTELNRGFDLTPEEVGLRASRAVEAMKEMEKNRSKGDLATEAEAKRKGGKFGNERGSIDPQVFRDIMDLGVHFARSAKNFAEWSGKMIKHTGVRSLDMLKRIWDQALGVVRYTKTMTEDQVRMSEYQKQYPGGYLTPPEEFTQTPEYQAKAQKLRASLRKSDASKGGFEYGDPVSSRDGERLTYLRTEGGNAVVSDALGEQKTVPLKQLVPSKTIPLSPESARQVGQAFDEGMISPEPPTEYPSGVTDPSVRPLHEYEGPERRGPASDFRKANLEHRQAMDMIEFLKQNKGLTPQQEAALRREANAKLSKAAAGDAPKGESPFIPAEGVENIGVSDLDKKLSEQRLKQTTEAQKSEAPPKFSLKAHQEFENGKTLTYWIADKDIGVDPVHKAGTPVTAGEIERAGFTAPEPPAKPANSGLTFGKLPDEPGGTDLGAMGGQELYDRSVKAIKTLSKNLGQAADNFDTWAADIRRIASQSGVNFTDQQLRDAWQSPEVRQQPGDRALAQAVARSVANGTSDSSGQRFSSKDVFDKARGFLDDRFSDPRKAEWANNFMNGAENIWMSRFGSSPTLSRVRTYARGVYEAATHVSTAKGLAYVKARNHFMELDHILGTKGMRNAFADLIADDRARALLANKDAIMQRKAQLPVEIKAAMDSGDQKKAAALQAELDDITVPPDSTIPMVSDETRNMLLNDPKIKAAIDYWHNKVNPDYESLSTEAGITSRLRGPLDLYNRMRWVDEETASKESLRDRELVRSGTAVGGSRSPFDVRPRASASARKATGVGPVGTSPENSLFHMIHSTFEARIPSIAVAELRQSIIDSAVAKGSELHPGLKPPRFAKMGGRMEPVVPITLEFGPGIPSETFYVPSMVASAYNTVMSKGRINEALKLWDKASNMATAQAVVIPAEAIRHGTNVVQVMATLASRRVPGLAAAPEAALTAATLGMSRIAHVFNKAWNLNGPELGATLADMAEGGALRLRGFEGYGGDKGFIMGTAEKARVPFTELKPLKVLKDFVFSDPGAAKGLGGLETRLRVVLWNMMKEEHPNATNAELGRRVNNSMGTYVRELVPPIAKALGPFDPFVRAGLAMTKTGIKAALGIDPTGKFSPWNAAATYGTVIAAQYYSSKLDDKGRMPYEIPGWKPTYAAYFQRNGKTYSIGLNDVVGPLSRASNFSGVRGIVESIHNNTKGFSNYAEDWGRSVANFWLSRTGPWARTIPHLFGVEPYILGDNSWLPGESPSMANSKTSPLASRAKLVIGGLVPWAAKLAELGQVSIDPSGDLDTGHGVLPESQLARIIYKTNDIFKLPFVPQLHQDNPMEKPIAQYRTQQQFEDTVNDIIRRARNLPEGRRAAFIAKEVEARTTEELINHFGTVGPAQAVAVEIIMRRLGSAPAGAAKGIALQEANAAPK